MSLRKMCDGSRNFADFLKRATPVLPTFSIDFFKFILNLIILKHRLFEYK